MPIRVVLNRKCIFHLCSMEINLCVICVCCVIRIWDSSRTVLPIQLFYVKFMKTEKSGSAKSSKSMHHFSNARSLLNFSVTRREWHFLADPKVCNTSPLALVTQQDVAHFIWSRFLTKMAILRIGQHRGNKLRCLQLQLGQTLLQQLVALHQFDSL